MLSWYNIMNDWRICKTRLTRWTWSPSTQQETTPACIHPKKEPISNVKPLQFTESRFTIWMCQHSYHILLTTFRPTSGSLAKYCLRKETNPASHRTMQVAAIIKARCGQRILQFTTYNSFPNQPLERTTEFSLLANWNTKKKSQRPRRRRLHKELHHAN